MSILRTMIGVAIVACILCTFTSVQAEEGGATTTTNDARVGTYDSRAIAAAYWSGERLDAYHQPLEKQIKEAKQPGI